MNVWKKSPIFLVNVAFQKCSIITARKRSLEQGNIFTPVCHSVHRGGIPACIAGGIPACLAAGGRCAIPACIGEWGGLLLGVPGPGGAWSRGMPGLGGSAPGGPASRGVPGGDPPRTATAAGGTHLTGMHSCLYNFSLSGELTCIW